MAFYDKAPGVKPEKKKYSDSWEEEGTRYSDAPERKNYNGRKNYSGSRNSAQQYHGRYADERDSRGYSGRSGYDNGRSDRTQAGNRQYQGRPSQNYDRKESGYSNRNNGSFKQGSYSAKRSNGSSSHYGPENVQRQNQYYQGPKDRHYEGREKRNFDNREQTIQPKRDYRDYEKKPAAPVAENPVKIDNENTAPENLLAGRNPIREALKSGRDIEKLLIQKDLSGSAKEIIQMAKDARVPIQEVDKIRLDELAPHHQGMLAFASAYNYSTVDDIIAVAKERNEPPFIILLDGVTDPHNLGAIIRSAECAGAHGVIVPVHRSVGLTTAAVKASAGSVEYTKVARVTNLNQTIEQLKKQGIWTYALAMDGEDYRKVDFSGGVALVIGSEGEGISRLTMENCDKKVSLPLKGHIDSLNASVAAGIVMYKVLEGRAK